MIITFMNIENRIINLNINTLKMKKIFLLFAVLFTAFAFANVDTLAVDSLAIGLDTIASNVSTDTTTFLAGTNPIEVATPLIEFDKVSFIDIIIPAIFGLVSSLFTDTLKHFKDGTWNFKVFYKTKLLPLASTILVLLVVYGVWLFLGTKYEFVLNTFKDNIGLFGFSSSFVIANVIDQLLKVNKKDNIEQING